SWTISAPGPRPLQGSHRTAGRNHTGRTELRRNATNTVGITYAIINGRTAQCKEKGCRISGWTTALGQVSAPDRPRAIFQRAAYRGVQRADFSNLRLCSQSTQACVHPEQGLPARTPKPCPPDA